MTHDWQAERDRWDALDEPGVVKNIPLARKVMEHIESVASKNGSWNQSTWLQKTSATECGTVGCFAGWAVQLGATRVEWGQDDYERMVIMPDGREEQSLKLAAAELLGLNLAEANRLFIDTAAIGNVEALREAAEAVFGERL